MEPHSTGPNMGHDSWRVVRELVERYPLIGSVAFKARDSESLADHLPFLGVLLSTIQQRETGACCVVLPIRDRIPFSLAVLAAVHAIQTELAGSNHLKWQFRPGQLVRILPRGRVFEFVGDQVTQYGRWLGVRNPRDRQVWYIPEAEAFRLTPTDSPSPSPTKGEGPGRWEAGAIDRLLGTGTGINLAAISNRIILVSSRSGTGELAASTRLVRSAEGDREELLTDLLTWGRIRTDGRLVSDDWRVGGEEPIIAVTHSVNNMALACRTAPVASKVVIVDGASVLTGNLQAFDDVARQQRLLIIADHDQLEDVSVLRERGCQVWLPHPDAILIGLHETHSAGQGWFARFVSSTRNAGSLSISAHVATDPLLEETVTALRRIEAVTDPEAEEARRIMSGVYGVLSRLTEWLGGSGAAARQSLRAELENLQRSLQRSAPSLTREFRQGITAVIAMLGTAAEGDRHVGAGKLSCLLSLLRNECSSTAIVVRSAHSAARLRRVLDSHDIQVDVHHAGSEITQGYDRIILGCWPGRRLAGRVINQYAARAVLLVGYPFEIDWLNAFQRWRRRQLSRFERSTEELRDLTGVRAWKEPEPATQEPSWAVTSVQDGPEEDPLSRFLIGRSKVPSTRPADEEELREAWYVGFHGPRYAFLTETHRVPVLTELVLERESSRARVPLLPVRKLQIGDYLLFRDQGDRDVIALIAEQQLGDRQYQRLREIAGRWRRALRLIGREPREIYRRLRENGLERNLLTVRIWLTDESMIAPGSRRDLEIIARTSGDAYLQDRLEEVDAAIRVLRGAHIQAGSILSELVLAALRGNVPEVDEAGVTIDFGLGSAHIVCIEEIGDQPEQRPYWEVNKLLAEDGE